MILLLSLPESYDLLLSSLIEGKTTLVVDEVFTALLKTGNEVQLTSFACGDRLALKNDSKASSYIGISRSRKRYLGRDENWFKSHLRCDI